MFAALPNRYGAKREPLSSARYHTEMTVGTLRSQGTYRGAQTRHLPTTSPSMATNWHKLRFMARNAQPTDEQLPVLKELQRAAALRHEANRLYLAAFHRALNAGARPSIIARYAQISPQAANSMRIRLATNPPDSDAPATVNEAVRRART